MKYNDLSNRQAPSLLFRVDDFLVKHKDDTLTDKVLNKLLGANKRAVLEPKVVSAIRGIFRHTDYSVGLVCLESEWYKYTDKFKAKIIDLPIGDIHVVPNYLDIFYKIQSREYIFYVDSDDDRMNQVGHENCLNLDGVHHLIKGGYRFE